MNFSFCIGKLSPIRNWCGEVSRCAATVIDLVLMLKSKLLIYEKRKKERNQETRINGESLHQKCSFSSSMSGKKDLLGPGFWFRCLCLCLFCELPPKKNKKKNLSINSGNWEISHGYLDQNWYIHSSTLVCTLPSSSLVSLTDLHFDFFQ